MFLIYDTETTGLPDNFNAPHTDTDNWPRLVQLAWQLHDEKGELIRAENHIVRPDGFTIPFNSEQIHGISTERALKEGKELQSVLDQFEADLKQTEFVCGHNLSFDNMVMGAEYVRTETPTVLLDLKVIDTKDVSTNYCAIPGGKGGKFKWPTLTELHEKLFGEGFDAAHNAAADVEATARCLLELVRIGVADSKVTGKSKEFHQAFKEANPDPIEAIGLAVKAYHEPERTQTQGKGLDLEGVEIDHLEDVNFVHLHNHSQYSILESTIQVPDLIKMAGKAKMPAVAMTDMGNLMGAFQFVSAAKAYNASSEHKVKPIVGCELNLCKDRHNKSVKDNGFQQVFLAKNKRGYHNLAKLSSAAHIEGKYYVPRIDREILLELKEDIIALSGGLRGEISSLILNVGEHQAEEAFLWWKEHFEDDFYVELIRHGLPEEERVNEVLLSFCKKHGVKYLATNNSFYLTKEDADAHDVLLCIKEQRKKSEPIGSGRGFRYGFPNNEFYFKSADEMKKLFADLPEAIETTMEVADKVEEFDLERDVLLPKFGIPEQFLDPEDEKDGGNRGENAYLRHLTYEGAKERYGEELSEEVRERLDFELETIEKTGYPGYFLIVQDFIAEARKMGVSVGPGRGSAAGSAVAYCLWITNVDPIKYDLLFERFLNPERVSMPDIDIDFDDRGRGKVIEWVVNKYGAQQVAQIITYGTMAAKSSLRDCARVLELSLQDADVLAKKMPDIKLKKLFSLEEKELKEKVGDGFANALEIKEISKGDALISQVVNKARTLEGSIRNTGIHACGVIITPSDIREHIPVAVSKESELWCTQFDNNVVESAGLLKMDFLGLKNLTIIKDAIALIKNRHGFEIDPDEIPLDDPATYELFQAGLTVAIFQYESPGMQKHLKNLKPDKFEDLIAMNALYRPGPLQYIDDFIKRKHGQQEIHYDLPVMEKYLKDTYGITVYQEQVMLLSQELAGFSKGQADALRKAMGKKKKDVLDKMYPKFIEGCTERGFPEDKVAKIWKDWEAFASYAFNKSHSTCYAYVAFQTAYLKANYPAEYMAAVLTNNMNDIKEVTKFMEECRNLNLDIFGPSVNESAYNFAVNKDGQIRFGLGAIKGVGQGAVENIVAEREANGLFEDFFDFLKRVDLRTVNKKTLESLVMAGAFDEFEGMHRGLFFHPDPNGITFLERAVKFAQAFQELKNAPPNLFGEASEEGIENPEIPVVAPWDKMYALQKEKELVGIYISGHPLDAFKFHISHFCNMPLKNLDYDAFPELSKRPSLRIAGVLTFVRNSITKKGEPWAEFTLEDFDGSFTFRAFGKTYGMVKDYLVEGAYLYMVVNVAFHEYRNQYQINIKDVMLLSETMDKCAKSFTAILSLSQLTKETVAELDEVFRKYPGGKPLKIMVYDRVEGEKPQALEMNSGKVQVRVCEELVRELQELDCNKFRFN